MTIYSFTFKSTNPLGEIRDVFRQQILLPVRPPPGARFYLRQVSAMSTNTYTSSFQSVTVYIPELMGFTDQIKFSEYTINTNGAILPSDVVTKGLQFFLEENINNNSPFSFNTFPNLNLGRHSLTSHFLTLELKALNPISFLPNVYAYTVIIESDTE